MSPPTPYRRPRRLLALGAAFLLVIGGGSWSSAGPEADDDQLSSEDTYPTVAKDPDLDSHLAEIASTYDEEGSKAARSEAESSGADVKHQKVRVVLDVEPGERAAVEDRIRELGGEVEGDFAARIQALLPPSTIEDAADDAGVRYAHLPEPAEPQAVTGEGVGVTEADDWHGRGFTGDGVKVAIVDGGFAGFTDRQTEGDLPAGLTTRNFCADGFTSETDHGTAVAEILYEMAPDADLFLVCALNAVELGQALTYVKSVGVDIVSRSVGSFNTGRGDGTGGPGTADGIVADAVRSGILWVNAAGNHAHSHWGGRFSDADGDDFHNFTPTDEGNTVVMPAGEQLCFALRWDDWPRSDQDYDLGLHRSSDLAVVAASVDPQTGTQPPTEFLCYTSATTAAYTVSILKFDATETPRFDLFAVHELPFEHQVPAGSIVEPASSPDAFAAGAFCWRDGSLQSYSSRGPTIDGRTKPDILGPSRVATSTYGASTHCDPGGGGFGGTSASAPHVAGAAALVKEMHPSFDADQLQAFLEAAAKDQGEPGKDNSFGAGNLFLREPLCPGRSNSSGTHFVGTNGPDTFTGTLGSDVMCGLGGNDTLRGRKGKDVLIGGGGNDRLIGGEQNDTLQGQAGADILKGQTGRDVLDGGGGTDRCLPGGANETIRGCER